MAIERLTVRQLIEQLQQFPDDLPVVIRSYEEGFDPVTTLESLTVAETPDRAWYMGVYDSTREGSETVLLIASKYHKSEVSTI